MDCDHGGDDDQQPSTSAGRTLRRSAERCCRLSWRHCRPTDNPGANGGGGGSAAAVRFNLNFVEKCRRRGGNGGVREFAFPEEMKSFCRQAYEFLMPLTAARAVGEMLAEVCLDDESREQFGEAIAEYVRAEKVAERAAAAAGNGSSLAVVEAAMEVVTTVYDDDDDNNNGDDDDNDQYEKENQTVYSWRMSERLFKS